MRKRPLILLIGGLLTSLFMFLPRSLSDAPPQDSEFVYARIRYHVTPEGWRMREAPIYHDYPYGDETFPTVFGEVSTVKTGPTSFKVVDIDSPELFRFPFAYFAEPGYVDLSPSDAANLKEYLDRGGFLFVDDFRTAEFSRQTGGVGEDDIAHFRRELKKMYPDRDTSFSALFGNARYRLRLPLRSGARTQRCENHPRTETRPGRGIP